MGASADPQTKEHPSATQTVLIVCAAWTLAVTLPLLDLLGRTPPFLVAHDLLGFRLVVFAVVIAGLLPLSLGGLIAGARELTESQSVVIAPLGVLIGAVVVTLSHRALALPGWLLVFGGLVVGLLAGYAVLTDRLMRRVAAVAGIVAPVSVVVLFLAVSPARALLVGGTEAAAAAIGRPTPVFVLLLDELPLSSLLTAEGSIDVQRYPAFADLVDTSTWYPRATTVSANTDRVVPAVLTGRPPTGQASLPVAAEHPGSLFELLAGVDLLALEPVTRMCQFESCRAPSETPLGLSAKTTATDTSIVYLHQVLPTDLRGRLPSVDESWLGFADDAPASTSASGRDLDDMVERAVWDDSAVAAEQFIDAIGEVGPNSFSFGHVMLPHAPWTHLPDGRVFQTDRVGEPGRGASGRWSEDEWLVTHAYRRHLLQVQYSDRVVGDFMAAVRDRGLWDEALVIVLSDHGVTIQPGERRRSLESPSAAADVAHIPLFVKAPDQVEGRVDPFPALVTDVAPTVIDVLEVSPEPQHPGVSLVDDEAKGAADRKASSQGELLAASARKYNVFDLGDPAGLYAFGKDIDLLGEATLKDERRPVGTVMLEQLAALQQLDASDDVVPALVSGTVADINAVRRRPRVAIAVDGTVAGVARTYGEGDQLQFQTLLDPAYLTDGQHTISAWLVSEDGTRLEERLRVVAPGQS